MQEDRLLVNQLLERFGHSIPWYRLPKIFGLLELIKIRNALREHNLHDTEFPAFTPNLDPNDVSKHPPYRRCDGSGNDVHFEKMGAVGTRFGRNFPLDRVHPDDANLTSPSPRLVSRKLLTRGKFQPVEILNLLAAAWIQFQVHDWFAHKAGSPDNAVEIPLTADDPWPARPLKILRTPAEPGSPGRPPAFANTNSHWWDGSQIYGGDEQSSAKLRTGFDGKMKIGDTALLPLDVDGVELTGFSNNWWIGLSMLHSLFVAEHNSICDRLMLENPDWSDDKLFQHGRLINSALMAKIHTVEWTPAILPHPTVATAMHYNWVGIAGEDLQDIFMFLDEKELLGGIVGSPTDHHTAPYSLTEEFAAVYRMHPLMPDEFDFYSLITGKKLSSHTLKEVALKNTRGIMEKTTLNDLFYSFGIAHPGALRLHNFPTTLQMLTQNDGTTIDLAAIDIFRDRERGVPRYNDFRELLRMPRIKSFEEMTDDRTWARELKEVYGDVDKVDLMVGLFAEPLIPGFGFSETAFRIFILMASRRLKSDRFFTNDYNAQTYTETGLHWVRDNSMITVLLRHHPALEPALRGVANAFQPWKKVVPRLF